MTKKVFSSDLEDWLNSDTKKTFDSFNEVFAEGSFAVFIILLLAIPALPLPTGGISHVFEIIAMLLSLEMIVGRTTIWLPRRWRKRKLSQTTLKKTIPFVIKKIRWFEKYSRPRLHVLLRQKFFRQIVGVILFGLSLTAFLAPPFSGLDTLPALGAVLIALSLILGDVIIFLAGIVIGAIGIVTVVALGAVTINIFKHFF